MKMRTNAMIEVMKKHNITIPEPLPTIPVLLILIREAKLR